MNQKIRFIREILQLSKKEISSLLNISSYKYSSFENNETTIPCEILLLLSKIYCFDIDLLLDTIYDETIIICELNKHELININNKSELLDRLKSNLFSNPQIKMTYHSIKKVKLTFQKNIINNIKILMNKYGLRQEELADYCDIDRYSLSFILSEKKFINTIELIKISTCFNTSIDSIVNGFINTK